MSFVFPKKAKDLINKPLSKAIIKQRDGGGGKKLDYISGSTVTDMLNVAFDYKWDWIVDKEWIQPGEPYFNKYAKDDKGKISPKFEDQGPVAHVRGHLVVYMENESGDIYPVTKSGYGSKAIIGKQSEQESIFKAAGTDALKKAASLLGIGLELYRDEEEQEFYSGLTYVDPWNEEMKNKYASERTFITDVMTQHGLKVEDMDALIEEFSGGVLDQLDQVTPDNIEGFVAFLRAKMAQANAETGAEE